MWNCDCICYYMLDFGLFPELAELNFCYQIFTACIFPWHMQDLVIPSFKLPEHYEHSPLMGAPWKKRDILLFFRGDVGIDRQPW